MNSPPQGCELVTSEGVSMETESRLMRFFGGFGIVFMLCYIGYCLYVSACVSVYKHFSWKQDIWGKYLVLEILRSDLRSVSNLQ